MSKDIDLYLDLPTDCLIDPKCLYATSSPGMLAQGHDRYRITVRLDSKYFESPIKGDAIVQGLKKLNIGKS